MMDKTFEIPEENFQAFETRMSALARRARRLGCPEVGFEVVGRGTATRTLAPRDALSFSRTITIQTRTVRVFGEAPVLGRFEFVAVLSQAPAADANLVKSIPSFDGALPERFRTSGMFCDHCRTDRRRRDVFVVRNREDGTFAQVGRDCLRDYLGHAAPEAIAAYAEILADAEDAADDLFEIDPFAENGVRGRLWNLAQFLAVVARLIRVDGWVSRSTANSGIVPTLSTADAAFEAMTDRKSEVEVEAQDEETAAAAIAWAQALDASSDYEHNVKTIAAGEFVDLRSIGFAASIVSSYLRAMEREIARKAREAAGTDSKFQGAVGDRLEFAARVLSVRVIQSEGPWGDSFLVKFADAAGNLYSTFASNTPDLPADASGFVRPVQAEDVVRVRGTVKAHREFRGVAETNLSRVKVVAGPFETLEAAAPVAAPKAPRKARKAAPAGLAPEVVQAAEDEAARALQTPEAQRAVALIETLQATRGPGVGDIVETFPAGALSRDENKAAGTGRDVAGTELSVPRPRPAVEAFRPLYKAISEEENSDRARGLDVDAALARVRTIWAAWAALGAAVVAARNLKAPAATPTPDPEVETILAQAEAAPSPNPPRPVGAPPVVSYCEIRDSILPEDRPLALVEGRLAEEFLSHRMIDGVLSPEARALFGRAHREAHRPLAEVDPVRLAERMVRLARAFVLIRKFEEGRGLPAAARPG